MNKPSKKQRRKKKKKLAIESKKVRDQKKKALRPPWQPIKMKLFQAPNPFENIPKEKRIEILKEFTKKIALEFEEKFCAAEQWLNDYDPIYILSFCAFYFTSHPEGRDPEVEKGRLDFPPHLLEILQALALTQKRNSSLAPLFEKGEELRTAMRELGDLNMMRLIDYDEKSP